MRMQYRWLSLLLYTGLLFTLAGASLAVPPPSTQFPAPWFVAAQRWPGQDAEIREAPSMTTEQRFASLLKRTMQTSWIPGDPAAIPYLQGWGFVYTRESGEYRLRVREVLRPVYLGAPVMSDGLVLAVEPITGKFPVPRTRAEMVALLGKFLHPDLLEWPENPAYKSPTFVVNETEAYYALPRDLYAWTDGTVLRIAYYQEPAYQKPTTVLARVTEKAATDTMRFPLPGGMENPWMILAALDWPARNVIEGTATAAEREHFALWARGSVNADWLPMNFDRVPYVKGAGFVYVKTTREYRLRLREVAFAFPRPQRGIVLAVEPLIAPFTIPQDEAAMLALLQLFVNPQVLSMPALDQCPPELQPHAGGMHYARYRTEDPSAAVPVNLFAWTNGKILLIGLPQTLPGECETCGF